MSLGNLSDPFSRLEHQNSHCYNNLTGFKWELIEAIVSGRIR